MREGTTARQHGLGIGGRRGRKRMGSRRLRIRELEKRLKLVGLEIDGLRS